jgi:hypothetical protein
MNKTDYVIWLGLAAAAGGVLGLLADRKKPAEGGLLGAAAGIAAGMVIAGVYEYANREEIPFYTSLSPMYEEADVA